jgi:hypothetical protein
MMMIRSQDKANLVPLGKVHILEGNGFFMIYDEPFYKGATEVGRYDSESRCLEILDEIQKMVSQYVTTQNGLGVINFAFEYPKVYEMPEK